MIIHWRVYLMVSLYLIALSGFLVGLALFQFLPAGLGLMTGGLLALSALTFAGAAVGLSRAFRE